MIRGRSVAAAMAVIGLASIGLPVAAAGHAGASVPVASHRFGAPGTVHRVAGRPRASVLQMADRAKIASVQPASVAPVSQLFPACYGDSRNISGFRGSLRPASFGAFYSCIHHAWTFEVQTADTWAKNSLGAWGVFIDTDGNFNDSCGGYEYLAFVEQTGTTGDFIGGVQATTGDPTGQNCTFGTARSRNDHDHGQQRGDQLPMDGDQQQPVARLERAAPEPHGRDQWRRRRGAERRASSTGR